MKLTKGMKKALSLLLSAAMVVTGVNVTTNTAKAADGDVLATWTGEMWVNKEDLSQQKSETDASATAGLNAYFGEGDKNWNAWAGHDEGNTPPQWAGANFTATFPSTNVSISVKVSGVATSALKGSVKVDKNDGGNWAGKTFDLEEGGFVISYPLPAGANNICISPEKTGVTITKIEFVEGTLEEKVEKPSTGDDPSESADPSESTDPSNPSDEIVPVADVPEKGDMSEFCIWVEGFADGSWGNQSAAGVKDNALVIKKNGTYEMSVTPDDDAAGFMTFYLHTNLFNGSTTKDFKLTLDKLTNGDQEYTVDNTKGSYFTFADCNIDKCFRLNIANEYNSLVDPEDLQTNIEGTEKVNAFGEVVELKAGQKITATFTVSGMDKDAELYTYTKAGGDDPETPAPGTSSSPAPGTSTSPNPASPTTPATNSVVSNSGVTSTAVVGTQKIAPAKKTVVVAPNKSVKVNFTKTMATGVTQAAVVTATIKSKKVVASAKVTGATTAKKGTVTIKAAKKATKGASTTVTLKSTNKDGKTVSAKITVKIQNKVKKVKAAKKAVTIKKKGKTAKLVLKVTAENKKKATTDSVSIKGAGKKVVSIKSAKASKGKITLTLKGKKKGSKKVTFKVGKKTVKVKVTVKK